MATARTDHERWLEYLDNPDSTPPFGRCRYCHTARSDAGCLNLCELPAGAARNFTTGRAAVITQHRQRIQFLEGLGGCTCPPPRLTGYNIARVAHDHGCPATPVPPGAPGTPGNPATPGFSS